MARKVVSEYAVFENIGGTRDIVFYYADGTADSVSGVNAAEAKYIADLLRNEKPITYDAALKRLSTSTPEPVGEAEKPVDVSAWLTAHAAIANSIVWQDAGGAHAWPSWSAAWKSELQAAFGLARARGSIAVAAVPPNQANPGDNDFVTTVLAPADAWAYFKASVAQALAAEIGGHFFWSLSGYSATQLAELFDSRQMFYWNASPAGYRIDSAHGHIIPAPPAYTYAFLGTNRLIGWSRLDTLANLIEWCRANLQHFTGAATAAGMQDQWQYRGFPPMTRVIEGTVQTSNPSAGARHRTAGCWGTTGFLRAALRAVNIPARLVTNAGHAQPWFMADGRYLSHGDDPYNALTKAMPAIPAAEILIDASKFDAWFGPGVAETDKANNIGRRPVELALTYLPNYLLRAYCQDMAAGKTHANGGVFDIFSRNYTVAQLEAQNLWGRMDAKIAGFGGCGHIPA
jgi:hypothetical protein